LLFYLADIDLGQGVNPIFNLIGKVYFYSLTIILKLPYIIGFPSKGIGFKSDDNLGSAIILSRIFFEAKVIQEKQTTSFSLHFTTNAMMLLLHQLERRPSIRLN